VEDYLRLQKRFAHLFPGGGSPGQPEMLARIQAEADRNIRRFDLIDGPSESAEAATSAPV
jgi:pyruvate ferredoxin oxidoreductase beta subunit